MSCAAPTPPPARGAPAGALAPGFRFHPTDEELVSYYLRRKVAGRPFRVDAIGEVDLYRSEPWDLPGKSRIQSRDMEWYFFSALDKKYSNRSRTNRATGSGYWKTTGKDRPVCRGGRTIGMKKTLVFHVGRAPKGDRTNWVMHEYRLEDEQLARAGITQDAFVVCRIFQKRGPGPQNGAQYGAPFVEEDWEEDEPIFFNEEALNGVDNPVTPEIDHYGQIQDMSVQDENNSLLLEPGEQVDFNDCVNPKLYNDQGLSNGPREKIEAPELYNDQNLVGTIGDSDAADQNPSLEVFNDEFLELNDFAYPIDTDSRHGEVHSLEMCNDANFVNGEISSEKALHHMNNFFNTDDENVDLPELFRLSQTVENDYYVELGDLLGPEPGHHSSGEPEDDEMQFFDAPSHYPDAGHVLSVDVNNFVDSTIPSSSGPDLVDELIAYFDATENMQSSELGLEDGADTSNQPNTAPIVNEHNVQTYQASPQPSDIDGGKSSLSSVTPNAGEVSRFKSVDIHGQPDARSDDTWDNPFSKRLASMLGSISSPPAFAAEYPMKEAKSIEHYLATRPSSSIHFTAGMIQVHGVSTPGNGKNWSVLKNGDEGFLSYGITRSDETGNLASFEILPKMPGGIMAFVQRNSFHLIFLSVLLLAASFKIWVCIYTN